MPLFLIIPSLVISRIVLTKYLLGWRADKTQSVFVQQSFWNVGMSGMNLLVFGCESVSDPCFTYFTDQLLNSSSKICCIPELTVFFRRIFIENPLT